MEASNSYRREQNFLAAEREVTMREELAAANVDPRAAEKAEMRRLRKIGSSFKKYQLDVRDDVRIVGQDPEYADLDNPRGYIYRRFYFLRASNEYGMTKVYGAFDSEELALAAHEMGFTPLVQEWHDDEPVYASLAYEDMGCEEQRAEEERNEGRF